MRGWLGPCKAPSEHLPHIFGHFVQGNSDNCVLDVEVHSCCSCISVVCLLCAWLIENRQASVHHKNRAGKFAKSKGPSVGINWDDCNENTRKLRIWTSIFQHFVKWNISFNCKAVISKTSKKYNILYITITWLYNLERHLHNMLYNVLYSRQILQYN